jgi:hypothetical protein
MTRLRIACLAVILQLTAAINGQIFPPAGAPAGDQGNTKQEDSNYIKALAAKKELSKKLSSDAFVIGVGIGSSNSLPVLNVYVTPKVSKESLSHIPKSYRGFPVSVLRSELPKAQ